MMDRSYFTPRGIVRGFAPRELIRQGSAAAFLDGACTAIEVTRVSSEAVSHTVAIIKGGAAPVFATPRRFAGVDVSTPVLMGIVNVTPDSFSDGGQFYSADAAVAHGVSLLEAGADLLDVGGESTRPGAAPVTPDEERRRVLPVIKALAERGARVSVDTRHASTMAEAIAAGAGIVNDVGALSGPGALDVVAGSNAGVVLMHMQGQPGTMQQDPRYVWAPGDIYDFLKGRIDACVAAGIARERISIDPGIGFGKTDAHNAEIFDHLAMFTGLGCVVLMGASRKGVIGRWSKGEAAHQRMPGSVAAALVAVERGARILRVHDVAETRQALAVWAKC